MSGKPRNNHDPRCLALGQNIKKLREKRGLTQEALSERADIHVSYIGQIERGLRYPSLKILFRVADVLEVKISELFRGVNANGKK